MTVTHPLYVTLYLISVILLVLAAFDVVSSRINLLAAGVAAFVLVALLTSLSVG